MSKRRFIKSVTEDATKTMPEMPWARGKRRAAFILKRKPVIDLQRTA